MSFFLCLKFERELGICGSFLPAFESIDDIINKGEENVRFEEELAKDVLEIITVFSARLYGSRSGKSKKMLQDVEKAVKDNIGED